MITSTRQRYPQRREAAACQPQPSIAAAAALFCPVLRPVIEHAGQLCRVQHGCRQLSCRQRSNRQHGCRQCSCRQLLGLTVMHSR